MEKEFFSNNVKYRNGVSTQKHSNIFKDSRHGYYLSNVKFLFFERRQFDGKIEIWEHVKMRDDNSGRKMYMVYKNNIDCIHGYRTMLAGRFIHYVRK